MRQDMDNVIVERPRAGSRRPSRKKGYRRFVERTPIENLPRCESMLGRWRGREKMLNEHLGPMRRFLRSNIGRPWNKVHQELCEFVSFNNAVQAHVLSHVFDYVHQHVEIRGDAILAYHRFGLASALRPEEMYICPKTGLLKVVKSSRRRRPRRRVNRDQHTQFHWRDNAWWELRVRKRPAEPDELWDVWLEKRVADISKAEALREYSGEFFAISKRPLRREETRRLLKELRTQRPTKREKRLSLLWPEAQ